MKLLSFKHIFILGALFAAGSVQAHAADEVTGKSEELELTDSIVHDTLVLADGKLATPINNVNCFKSISSRFIIVSFIFLAAK